ncbi:MAG: hypothetical protein AB1806_18215 [Acidobacteriota bacterium]
MKILFSTSHFGFLRNFEHGLAELARRGHRIHLLADRRDTLGGMRTLENLQRVAKDAFTWEISPSVKSDPAHLLKKSLRLTLDYWRYLDPVYASAVALRERAAREVPRPAVRIGNWSLIGRHPPVRRMLSAAIRAMERAVPGAPFADDVLRTHAPDVFMVTPLLYFGSQQVDYVRAARRRGIPSVLCVGSWDHLTTKGLIHEIPDAVTVWNEAQREEAASLHHIPAGIVRVTGASAYDHWFAAAPTLTRDEFCSRTGLPAGSQMLCYLCSSPFITPYEVGFVRRWLLALRAAPDARLRSVAVLIRPHPQNADQWRDEELSALGPVIIWPRAGSNPVDAGARADYFHSMYYSAAVVGVNTSALIESGIVGRPVFTVRTPEFSGTQDGTLHFQHLKQVSGGLLVEAASLDEHVAQLGALLENPGAFQNRGRAFIETFVRPHGLDRPASPILADAIEEVAQRPIAARGPGLSSAVLRPAAMVLARLARRLRRSPKEPPSPGADRAPRGRRLLFVMRSPEYLRFYDDTLKALAARGLDVVLAVNATKGPKQARFRGGSDGIRYIGDVPARCDAWGSLADWVRGTMDFIRYLDPRLSHVPALRARMKIKALPGFLRWLDRFHQWPPGLVRSALGGLAWLETVVPPGRRVVQFVKSVSPNAVLVTPLVEAASDQMDLVRAARASRIPVVACIASWDNLTNKGLLRIEPDLVTVWNEAQKREAVELHDVSAERVAVTGAQAFDRWFDREPSRTRVEFCAMVGLNPARPIILFTGSSFFITGRHSEVPFVRSWVDAVRNAGDASVREANILIRPHPYNADQWAGADLSDLTDVAIWPRGRHDPTNEQNRGDFFDSLFHSAAVVGINTSAMIEASVIGRPVHTLLSEGFGAKQEGTVHFQHLLPENGGCLIVAKTLPEHLDQLAASIAAPDAARARSERFVATFLRPHGLEKACVPILTDVLEGASALTPLPFLDGVGAVALRFILAPLVGGVWLFRRGPGRVLGPDFGRFRKKVRFAVHRRRKSILRALKQVPRTAAWRRLAKAARDASRAARTAASSLPKRIRRVGRHARYGVATRVRAILGANKET